MPDTTKTYPIIVTEVTNNSISISWNKATDEDGNEAILYKVYLSEEPGFNDWRCVEEGKNLHSCTFADLKAGTGYAFFVQARFASGIIRQYPELNGFMTARTAASDTKPPTVADYELTVTEVTHNSFTVSWKAAMDDTTPAHQIRYEVYLCSDKWALVEDAPGITSYTFTDLKPDTAYRVFLQCKDAAGNVGSYMKKAEGLTVRTKPDPVRRLSFSIEQNARVLTGTNTISLAIEYNYVQLNQNGEAIGIGSGTWKQTWSDQRSVSDVIVLPANCFFKDNRVFIRIQSRKAASAGLNKWKTCNEGYVDVADGHLKFRLTGNYYTHDVNLGGTAAMGYAQFIAPDAVATSQSQPQPAVTQSASVNRLAVSIKQGASVLSGTDTICLELAYNRVLYDADGKVAGREKESWKHKWSNRNPVSTVIQLPAGWYFENNQVYIYIDSRRAASVGLNKWKKCSDGYVDISSGNMILELYGSYYSYSVQFKQIK